MSRSTGGARRLVPSGYVVGLEPARDCCNTGFAGMIARSKDGAFYVVGPEEGVRAAWRALRGGHTVAAALRRAEEWNRPGRAVRVYKTAAAAWRAFDALNAAARAIIAEEGADAKRAAAASAGLAADAFALFVGGR